MRAALPVAALAATALIAGRTSSPDPRRPAPSTSAAPAALTGTATLGDKAFFAFTRAWAAQKNTHQTGRRSSRS